MTIAPRTTLKAAKPPSKPPIEKSAASGKGISAFLNNYFRTLGGAFAELVKKNPKNDWKKAIQDAQRKAQEKQKAETDKKLKKRQDAKELEDRLRAGEGYESEALDGAMLFSAPSEDGKHSDVVFQTVGEDGKPEYSFVSFAMKRVLNEETGEYEDVVDESAPRFGSLKRYSSPEECIGDFSETMSAYPNLDKVHDIALTGKEWTAREDYKKAQQANDADGVNEPGEDGTVETEPVEVLDAVQCKGMTEDGDRCRNTTTDPSGYCEVHRDQKKESMMAEMLMMAAECTPRTAGGMVKKSRCQYVSEKGKRCSRFVKNSAYCWQHASKLGKAAGSFALAPRVPDEVGDIDENPCPLCGDPNYDGVFCNVCGYEEPPLGFGDIELETDEDYERYEQEAQEADEVNPLDSFDPDAIALDRKLEEKADELADSAQEAEEEHGEDADEIELVDEDEIKFA